jgi:predicted AlkP superfamily phosphohydrolase/phosphomutase
MPSGAANPLARTAGALLLAALLGPLACGRESPPPAAKVLVIGLDGLEWDLVTPMVADGELPNLARLIERGVHGKLRSLEPLAKSPTIWTTIATGKTPQEHGIGGYADRRGRELLTGNVRRVEAIWNIASSVGKSVGVVGWLMTWPAETVNGVMVSNYLQYGRTNENKMEDRTYPPDLDARLAPDVTDAENVPYAAVERFLDQPLDTTSISPHLDQMVEPIKWTLAGDLTYSRIGLTLYRRHRPDFFAVYLRGTDDLGHRFWNYMVPDSIPATFLDPDGMKYFKGTERAYYRFTDQLIGPLIDAADDSTTIVVLSDHGFRGGTGHGVEVHKLDGVLIMAGRGVGHGEITGADVYDITPTLLVLLGLPPAQDMRGKVLWSALDPSIPRDRFEKQLIATYETGHREGTAPRESPVDEQLKERLRSLGYLD